jgi:nucleoside-diphosphate-sugar epimerase
MLVSVTQRLTLAALSPALSRPSLDVYYLVPPGRSGADPSPQEVLLEGVANVVAHLKQANIRRAVLTSSTAVYGQSEGQAVDASSEAQPPQERGQWLVQAERIWLESPLPSQVVRLAGIYGPGRVIGQRAVREGQPLVGDPHAYLNLIHVDDVVELLLTLVSSRDAAPIELGCDNQPPKRLEYYHELAKRLGVSPPRVMSEPEMVSLGIPLNLERLRRSSNKICVNTPTRERTGWVPQYPSYHQGLTHALG